MNYISNIVYKTWQLFYLFTNWCTSELS